MKYQIIVYSFANPLAEPIWCDDLKQVDDVLGQLPFGAPRDVLDQHGNFVADYIPL